MNPRAVNLLLLDFPLRVATVQADPPTGCTVTKDEATMDMDPKRSPVVTSNDALAAHDLDGKTVGGTRILNDDRFQTDEAFARRWYYHYMKGHPFGHSNRILHRTNGYLRCLGDPQQPFNGRGQS